MKLPNIIIETMDRSPKTFKKPIQRQTTLSKGGDLNRLNVQKTENKVRTRRNNNSLAFNYLSQICWSVN